MRSLFVAFSTLLICACSNAPTPTDSPQSTPAPVAGEPSTTPKPTSPPRLKPVPVPSGYYQFCEDYPASPLCSREQ